MLVSRDLQARVRLGAALQGLDVDLVDHSPEATTPPDADVVVLDLDALGRKGAARWAAMTGSESRLVGFFSHVDSELGDEAETLGIETHRRGRFWRAAGDILSRALERGG